MPAIDEDNCAYDLYGFIYHKGDTTDDGHYIAIVKTGCSAPHKKGTWVVCNDSEIREIKNDEELKWFRERAYVYFYQLRVNSST